MPPQVSIIIPVKDRKEPLIRALRSVEAQSYKDLEVILIDDHSLEPLSSFIKPTDFSMPLHFLHSEGHGVSAARNKGIKHSQSEWIALLDSDDEWLPKKLESQMKYAELNPHHHFIHTEEEWFRNGQKVKQHQKYFGSGGRVFERLTKICFISPSTVTMRKSLFDEVGLFDEKFVICEDHELWLRIAVKHEVGHINEALTIKHGGHEDQLSRKHHSADLWRVRALNNYLDHPLLSDQEKLSAVTELRFKCQVLLKGFEKHQNFTHRDEVGEILRKSFQFAPSLS